MQEKPSVWSWIAGLVSLQVLLTFCYRSTDFEVHRNWLAITSSLQISKWYTDNTSEWTLDYPPFFAYFEYFLSLPAQFFYPQMLSVQKQPYFSHTTLYYQRITVIVSNFLFIHAALRLAKLLQRKSRLPANRSPTVFLTVLLLLIGNAGLILVDCIHFQYNGFLSGMLLHSICCVFEERFLMGAAWYCVLVNFKHIYLYLAPAYAAYYLRNYCMTEGNKTRNVFTVLRSISVRKCAKLLAVILAPFFISLAPFVFMGQLPQVLSRLFPFKRGLTHAYWAPNIWALYNFVDLCLYHVLKRTGLARGLTAPTYTSGLVQEYAHSVLPNVTPLCTLLLTLAALIPFCLLVALVPRRSETFVKITVFCAFTAYMCGWHVHEKALLLITVPLTVIVCKSHGYAKVFVLLSTVGHFSLWPLFFTQFESPLKHGITVAYGIFTVYALSRVYRFGSNTLIPPFFEWYEFAYTIGLVLLEVYKETAHHLLAIKFAYLPLLMTSVYGSVGMVYCYALFSWCFLCDEISIDVWLYKRSWAKEQERLKAALVVENDQEWQEGLDGKKSEQPLKFVGGLDSSTSDGDELNACVCLTVLTFPELEVVHTFCERTIIDKPYVAGFLAFREVQPMVDLVRKFSSQQPNFVPQVLLVDGNGILHPRGFGLASHVGVLLNIPTIGVAKNLHLVQGLVRDMRHYEQELVSAGQTIPLKSHAGEVIGAALRPTESSKNPVFVSVGHKIDLQTAIQVVTRCSKYRVPEPIRQADQASRIMVKHWFD